MIDEAWRGGDMRDGVLPRAVAERVITGGVARAVWAVNAANLALTVPLLVEFLGSRGLDMAVPVPLGILVLLFVLSTAIAVRPTWWAAVVFSVVGAAGAFLYELLLMGAYSGIAEEGMFLLNRPALSLVLIGVAGTGWISGILWTIAGLLVSTGVSLAVALTVGSPLNTGYGPAYVAAISVTTYFVLAAVQRKRRRRVPNFDELEEETRRLEAAENLRAHITSTVHDTLLNDLSIVMNAPDELDERTVQRLRADLGLMKAPEWLAEADRAVLADDQDSEMRNEIMLLVSEFQWRGLTVHVTGSGSGIYRLAPEVATALMDAIRACLENVIRHSGSTIAEIDMSYTSTELTVITSDQGSGFDAEQVPPDRLGVRLSIVERVRAVGGSAKIWSSPGAGTAVIIRMPILEVLSEHEESTHGSP